MQLRTLEQPQPVGLIAAVCFPVSCLSAGLSFWGMRLDAGRYVWCLLRLSCSPARALPNRRALKSRRPGGAGSCLSWRDVRKVNGSCRQENTSAGVRVWWGSEPHPQRGGQGASQQWSNSAEQSCVCGAGHSSVTQPFPKASPIRERTTSLFLRWVCAWQDFPISYNRVLLPSNPTRGSRVHRRVVGILFSISTLFCS